MPAIASHSVVPSPYKYDVFLSFRGEDTRNNFTSHLYAALGRKKIFAYIDNNLESGEEIASTLLTTIEESKLSIVIFSKNFASSRWCLDELVRIIKCKEERGHIVLPVFHGIDPSDVRHQKGNYAKAFVKHEERYKNDKTNKLQEWRKALTAAANLSGFDSRAKLESKVVEEIVTAVLEKLYSISKIRSDHDFTGLVGMEKRFEKMESLLGLDSPDVRIIGIWGMGGIGKTTLAQTVYEHFYSQFEGCFFAIFGEESKEDELHHLKENMFSTLLKDKNLDHMHSSFANEMLRRRKVLVVLDNVKKLKQIECLLGVHVPKDRFGVGSRIILATRDRKLLGRAGVVYAVEGLDFNEAFELFCWKAFDGDSPMKNFMELSKRVVDYAQGNPLALHVLGSHLHSRVLREWENTLMKLEKTPDENIDKVLKISYDALDDETKVIFLDIACFLISEDRDLIERILGIESHIGINILIEKSLVTVKNGKLWMHDLLQRMAWKIIREEPKELRQHRMLLNAQDVYHVLKNNKGTIEVIFLDMSKVHEDICLRSNVFEDMRKLILLKIIFGGRYFGSCNSKFINGRQGLQNLPHSLRYLQWSDSPSRSLASNFEPQNPVKLDMLSRKLKEVWNGVKACLELSNGVQGCSEIRNGVKHLGNAKEINLSCSEELIKLADLSLAQKLENVNIRYRISLHRRPDISVNIRYIELEKSGIENIPSRFGSLESIVRSDLSFCERLSHSSNIWKLISIKELSFSCCSRWGVLPEISEVMEHFEDLSLDRTRIEEPPPSIKNITGLGNLDLSFRQILEFFPKWLNTYFSTLNLGWLRYSGLHGSILTTLNLSICNVQEIPSFLGLLSSLTYLVLRGNFSRTQSFSLGQLTYLCSMEQSAFLGVISKFLSTNAFWVMHEARYVARITCYPGTEIPMWFSSQAEGSTATIKLHPKWGNTNFLGFATCVVLELDDSFGLEESLQIFTSVHYKANSGENLGVSNSHRTLHNWEASTIISLDQVFMWYHYDSCIMVKLNVINLDAAEASFEFSCYLTSRYSSRSVKVKRCGVGMINRQEVEDGFRPISQDTTIVEEIGECFSVCSHTEKIIIEGYHDWSDVELRSPDNDPNSEYSTNAADLCLDSYSSQSEEMNIPVCHDCSNIELQRLGNNPNCDYSTTVDGLCLDSSLSFGKYSEEFIHGRHDCSDNSNSVCCNSGCLISELLEEPVVITNQPQPSGTETINSDAEESHLQRTQRFDFCGCIPFLSIINGSLQ